jgi:MFS family permease
VSPAGNRDFRLLWVGDTTSKFGSRISGVALPLIAITMLGSTTFEIGVLAAASWLPWVLIGLPAGAWVDRLPRRPILLAANLASMLLMASVPVAAWLGALSIGHLLAVAVLTGAANVFAQTADQVYLRAVLPKEQLAHGNARLQGSASVADVAGPGVAGAIAQAFGAVTGLLADAVTFLVATVCLLRIRTVEARPRPREARRGLGAEILAGLRFVAKDGYLRVLTVQGAAGNLALTAYQTMLLMFLIREVGASTITVGVLLTTMSVGGVIGAACATRVAARLGTAHGMLLCQLLSAPFALLIPLTGPGPRLGFTALAGIAIGAGVVAANVIRGAWRQAYTPGDLLGRVTVSMQFLNYGTIPLGALLGGALGQAMGLRQAMWVTTAAVALAPLLLLMGPIRKSRDLPVQPA